MTFHFGENRHFQVGVDTAFHSIWCLAAQRKGMVIIMSATRTVTMIPPTIDLHTHTPATLGRKRRVAGYARVSTDKDEQFTSYEAQVDYYTSYIQRNPEWEFVSVYTDEGISGLNTKKRDGFNQMVADALAGRIDLIVTKSVSRFARNTVDSLTTIRNLKEKGIEVYFEKENIWTFDGKGELLLTIMSSLAQEESRSISENIVWDQRKRFSDGKVSVAYSRFLGYQKGEDGVMEIVPEEAAIVQRIYSLFQEGKTFCGIAAILTKEGVPTPCGKDRWSASTVESIICNEKYKGDAVLQKTFTVDFLTKKMKINEGEVPQYYVSNSHPYIIRPDEWDLVQAEVRRRKGIGRRYSGNGLFASRLVCGDCGSFYGAKVWHSTSKYRRVIWQCNRKFKGDKKCTTPHLTEDEIKERFLKTYNALMLDRDQLLENGYIMQEALTDCTAIDGEMDALRQELEVVTELTRKCIEENSHRAQDQEEYTRRYDGYVRRYDAAKEKLKRLEQQKLERQAQANAMSVFLYGIQESTDCISEFDPKLWSAVVDTVVVHHDGRLVFKFTNGMEIEG